MLKYICDLCGEPIEDHEIRDGGARRFRIQERKRILGGFAWGEIDCHNECLEAVAAAARERTVGNDKG